MSWENTVKLKAVDIIRKFIKQPQRMLCLIFCRKKLSFPKLNISESAICKQFSITDKQSVSCHLSCHLIRDKSTASCHLSCHLIRDKLTASPNIPFCLALSLKPLYRASTIFTFHNISTSICGNSANNSNILHYHVNLIPAWCCLTFSDVLLLGLMDIIV